MTKVEFLGALQNLVNTFVFGHTLLFIAAASDLSRLQHATLEFSSPQSHVEVKLDALFAGVTSLKQRPIMVEEFQASLRRAVLAEFFECMRSYCQSTNQEQTLRSAPWYEFVRIARNTTSHQRGGHISWPPEFKKKGIKSVRWNHLEVDESMEGQELIMHDSDIALLLGDLRQFAEQRLS